MMGEFDSLIQHYRQVELRDEAARERLIQAAREAQENHRSLFARLMDILGGWLVRLGENLQQEHGLVLHSQRGASMSAEPKTVGASGTPSGPPC